MNLGSRVWQGECGEFPQVRKLLFAYVIDEGFDKINRYKGSLSFFPVGFSEIPKYKDTCQV